jgi:hypothetical protein
LKFARIAADVSAVSSSSATAGWRRPKVADGFESVAQLACHIFLYPLLLHTLLANLNEYRRLLIILNSHKPSFFISADAS